MEAITYLQPTESRQVNHSDHDLVEQLLRSDIYRDYQKAFETMTGLPLTLRAMGSFQAPWHGSRKTNAFCSLMASRNKTCSSCLQMQQRIETETHEQAQTFECDAGLSDSAVPIRVGERVIAYLQTGQIMLRPPSPALFRKTAKRLADQGENFEPVKLKKAYFETRVVSRQQYDSVLQLLSIFSQQLSALSNQLMVRQVMQENPTVMRARQFIAEHQNEELSLAQVAATVHMSRFYFCKVFKESTGLTFVEYLTRVRVEAVKKLLLDPHKRMSEAAYEAGFQSLSQFNRVFRAIAGESPSSYSEKMSKNSPGSSRLVYAA